jgi:DNA polymerase/3'-5' exonuclease PolX
MNSFNSNIIFIFQQLHDIRIKQDQIFKAKAYEKAITVLRNYPKNIESGEEAKQIRGIGQSLASKIDEIVRTGTLAELNNVIPQDEEKNKVIELFEKIERVGNKTACKWYDLGYRQLSDIPMSECNAGQWIGIQLYHELIQKIPRSEIQYFEQILHHYLDPLEIQFIICGSYRRGRAESGDIDVLIVDKPGLNAINEVLKIPVFTHTLAYGDKKYMGICKINQLHRRIDLESTPFHEFAFALMYFTGSQGFNVLMRQQAIDLGVRLNEKTLTREIIDTNGQKQILYYPAQTEADIFTLLGIQYLTPEERDRY